MAWKIELGENNAAVGFFPTDYKGTLPDSDFVDVSEDKKDAVLAIMPAYYDKTEKKFKHCLPRIATFEELKAQKKAAIAAARYKVETAGTTVNGVLLDTGRDSQALITGAALAAMLDSEYSLNWKTVGGFIHLSAPEIIAVAQAVRAHVQSCFDREGELVALVDAAQTAKELDAIEITFE